MTNPEQRRALKDVIERLIAEYRPLRVILYGSFASGEADADSDIDLLIVKETSARFLERWTEVLRIVSGLHRGIPVEPLVLTPAELERRVRAGDQFIAEVLARGQILYEAA
jgi:uncharacterized protein